jgi:hypothetical protein
MKCSPVSSSDLFGRSVALDVTVFDPAETEIGAPVRAAIAHNDDLAARIAAATMRGRL